MALVKREPAKRVDIFGRFFSDWSDMFRHPIMVWPEAIDDVLRVEEYRENGSFVIRADMPGIDPDKDVDLTVKDGTLHITAERKEEETTTKDDFFRRELRYGTFTRDLPMPEGASEEDVKATYKNGVLEIRVPMTEPVPEAPPKKIPVSIN